MRLFNLCCAALFISSMAFAQAPMVRGNYGGGYGPYVPMATVPEYTLQSVSPSPVGASNATTGLVAGATNSTLSMVNSDTSSVHTEAVWYAGGDAPLTSPAIHLGVQPLRAEHRRMEVQHERMEAAPRAWSFYSSVEETSPAEATVAAKAGKHAARTYGNQDVEQENQKNGMVKYDGKTEQLK